MVDLYGETLTRRQAEARTGDVGAFAGVRLMTLGDGVERGVRMLEFRTGTGLRFTVLVDRALDIAECEWRGIAIGWRSPAGFKHPAFHEVDGEGGLGWLRVFSGLMMTCGLDHTGFMDTEPADHYRYAPRETVSHTLHGRVATVPARLTGYGERWDGDDCTLWCEGTVAQATVFGEHLELKRRIEATVGTDEIRQIDRVVNRGFYRTPHMMLYHVNVGAPVLADGARYLAPIIEVVRAAHEDRYRDQGVGYRTLSGPREGFHEQVWQHETAADSAGEVPVALVNDRLGVGFEVVSRKDQLPCQLEWQNLQAGQYTIGLEPGTNHSLGHAAARDRGEVIWLEHGDARDYTLKFRVLAGADAIADAERRITAIARQPDDGYPAPTGNFRQLAGRR